MCTKRAIKNAGVSQFEAMLLPSTLLIVCLGIEIATARFLSLLSPLQTYHTREIVRLQNVCVCVGGMRARAVKYPSVMKKITAVYVYKLTLHDINENARNHIFNGDFKRIQFRQTQDHLLLDYQSGDSKVYFTATPRRVIFVSFESQKSWQVRFSFSTVLLLCSYYIILIRFESLNYIF